MNSNTKLLRGRSVEVCRQCGCVTECFFPLYKLLCRCFSVDSQIYF